MEFTRRDLFKGSAAAVVAGLVNRVASAADDPLPSWNDTATKKAIVDFVRVTTDRSNPNFVPEPERIATFDQDGTLWVEKPMYTQVIYCFDRVSAVVKAKPELAGVEPFKTVLSGNREAIAKLSMPDLEKILVATLTGMSVDEFQARVKNWLELPGIRDGKSVPRNSFINPCSKCSPSCVQTDTRPTSSPVAVKTSCAPIPKRRTASPLSRSLAPWEEPPLATTKPASHSSPKIQSCF
jgi:hypothetical protein